MRIKEWHRDGDPGFAELCETTDELMQCAGRRLDKACAQDITGEILFEGEDGKFYTGFVTFQLHEAHEDYVNEILAEDAEG